MVFVLDHLTEAQAKAYRLADNKLTDRSDWDDRKLAAQLKELSEIALEFHLEDTVETPEIDIRIQSLDDPAAADTADELGPAPAGPAVSRPGDLLLFSVLIASILRERFGVRHLRGAHRNPKGGGRFR